MKKTLLISYTPREGSYTKILVDEFKRLSQNKTHLIHVDLVTTPPDLLLAEHLNLLMEWNAGKRQFTKTELTFLSNHHGFMNQFLDADYIVLATPIYNFSLPATVKAWIDALVVSDKTFTFNPDKGFQGLCTDKNAISILVSGFNYTNSSSIKEYASASIKANFDFMGISSEQISAFGIDENRDQLETIIHTAKDEINQIIKRWY